MSNPEDIRDDDTKDNKDFMDTSPLPGDVMDPMVFGVMGGPGTGKSYVMDLVNQNAEELTDSLHLGHPLVIKIAKKSTSRENRGADDVWKESGLSQEEFADTEGHVKEGENFFGIYQLANNHAYYGYRQSAFKQSADILVAEPSIHHLTTIKSNLHDRLLMVCLVADRKYRDDRMNGRGTEDEDQIKKRLDEGDVQLFLLDRLTGGLKKPLNELIDPDLLESLEMLEKTKDNEEDFTNATTELQSIIGDQAVEYADLIKRLDSNQQKDSNLVNAIIYLDDSYLANGEVDETGHTINKLRDEVLKTVSSFYQEKEKKNKK